jgi:hypothetical protein
MFRENRGHFQETLFSSDKYMNPSIRKKLLNSWAAIFYSHVFCKINELIFSVLYSDKTGRPNFPVNILLSLEYIKHLFDYSDAELIEQYNFNYQLSYAVGIKSVGELNLCPRTIYDFRKRLYLYLIDNPESGDLIFCQFIELTQNFIKMADLAVDKQRMDSTMISANIKNAGRLALALDVIEQAIKVIPDDKKTESMKELLLDGYRNKLVYKSKGNQIITRIEEILRLCGEVSEIAANMPEIDDLNEIKILNRFILEQTKVDPVTGTRKVKANTEIEAKSMQSAYDTDATYRKKGNKSGKGYVVNISETCDETNDIQMITHYDVKTNVSSDAEIGADAIPQIKENFDMKELYVDGAYVGKDIQDAANNSNITLHHTDMTGKKTDPEKITPDDFEYNEDNTVKVCPANIEPIKTACNTEKGSISAHFSKEDCEKCELKEKCCVKEQVQANKLSTNQEELANKRAREAMQDERSENTSKRAAIEGTNSELKRAHGLDDVKVRGIAKVLLTTGLKITACNFKRFAKHYISKLANKAKIHKKITSQGIAVQF